MMTPEEKMVWSARFAQAVAERHEYPALPASQAVEELQDASLIGLTFLDNTPEMKRALRRLAEMQGKEPA